MFNYHWVKQKFLNPGFQKGKDMSSGSMIIPNYLGKSTTLFFRDNLASADPPDNALIDAKAALNSEKGSRSPKSGNIAFLTLWIRTFETSRPREDRSLKIPDVFTQEEAALAEEEPYSPDIVQFGVPSWRSGGNDAPSKPSINNSKSTTSSEVKFGKPSWEK